jgi:VanZ family protein
VEAGKKDLSDFSDSCSFAFPPAPSILRKIVCYWLPLIAYGLLIFLLSSLSSFDLPVDLPEVEHLDKVIHAGIYGVLGLLLYRAYRSQWPGASAWSITCASLLSAGLYGLTDEIHQYFVPERSADPWDWVADLIGALLGVMAYRAYVWVLARRGSSVLFGDLTKDAGLDK